MQISSQFRKPSGPLKQTHPKYITLPPCVPIGCTRQEVGSLESTLHSLQQTYLRPSIHITQNFTSSTPAITTVSSNPLHNRTSWPTQHALSTDHLHIITTINIRHDGTQFTEDTESVFGQTTITTYIHTANIIITNIILMADKHNIPKDKMHSNCRLLPNHIVCKITHRNNIRRANTCDPALKLLNKEITTDIQQHKQTIWKEHLDAYWDPRHNTHILWKTIHGLSNRAPPPTLNTSITFSNKIATTPKHIANCFTKQFTNTVKPATHKSNRPINRATHRIQGYNITLTTTQVQEAMQHSKNNNS